MIAVHTKFVPCTNHSGARIKAYTASHGDCKGFTVIISYPYELSGVECHFQAVKALVEKNNLDWNLDGMRYGDSADGKGFSFCFESSKI